MTQTRSTDVRPPSPPSPPSPLSRRVARSGLASFAAAVLLLAGLGQATLVVAALVGSSAATHGDVAALSPTAWTALHLTLGAGLAVAGTGLLAGTSWARPAAIVAAIGAVVADFVWSPSAPVLSVALITLALFALWALAADDGPDDAAA